jgi:RNA chaperone ProQ/FINO-like protein
MAQKKKCLSAGSDDAEAGSTARPDAVRQNPFNPELSIRQAENARTPEAVIALLASRWPWAFSVWPEYRRPLKRGIFFDLEQALGDAVTPESLSEALGCYVNHPAYWGVCTAGVNRLNLAGEPEGIVTKADAEYAHCRLHGLPTEPLEYWIPPKQRGV